MDDGAPLRAPLIVCDLGNVLIDFSWARAATVWAEAAAVDVPVPGLDYDEAWKAFEIGGIEENAFLDHLRRQCGHDVDRVDLLRGWNAIFTGINAEVAAVLTELRDAGLRVVAATNTNWPHLQFVSQEFATHLDVFSVVYASCELGLRKPDAAFFEHILEVENVPASDTIFIDDREENVQAAAAVRMRVIHFTDASALRRRLHQMTATPPPPCDGVTA